MQNFALLPVYNSNSPQRQKTTNKVQEAGVSSRTFELVIVGSTPEARTWISFFQVCLCHINISINIGEVANGILLF